MERVESARVGGKMRLWHGQKKHWIIYDYMRYGHPNHPIIWGIHALLESNTATVGPPVGDLDALTLQALPHH